MAKKKTEHGHELLSIIPVFQQHSSAFYRNTHVEAHSNRVVETKYDDRQLKPN